MSDRLLKESDVLRAIDRRIEELSADPEFMRKNGYIDVAGVKKYILAIPSADKPSEIIYGNEHNCIMTIFGECSYAETGCGNCAVVEKVKKALSADRPKGQI